MGGVNGIDFFAHINVSTHDFIRKVTNNNYLSIPRFGSNI
jgi:hypothetical protein